MPALLALQLLLLLASCQPGRGQVATQDPTSGRWRWGGGGDSCVVLATPPPLLRCSPLAQSALTRRPLPTSTPAPCPAAAPGSRNVEGTCYADPASGACKEYRRADAGRWPTAAACGRPHQDCWSALPTAGNCRWLSSACVAAVAERRTHAPLPLLIHPAPAPPPNPQTGWTTWPRPAPRSHTWRGAACTSSARWGQPGGAAARRPQCCAVGAAAPLDPAPECPPVPLLPGPPPLPPPVQNGQASGTYCDPSSLAANVCLEAPEVGRGGLEQASDADATAA